MASKKTYVVNADGYIAGAGRKRGEKIQLSEREAKYFVLSGLISEPSIKSAPAPKAEPNPTTLDKKTR